MNEHGRVDVRDNAGLGTAVPALKESPEDFRRVVHTNHSAHWMAKERAAVMGPGSSIVNIASILVLTAGFAPQAAYSSSKAAVLGLTRDLAAQWGSRLGIRVNAIAPGYFASEMTDEIPERMLETITSRTPSSAASAGNPSSTRRCSASPPTPRPSSPARRSPSTVGRPCTDRRRSRPSLLQEETRWTSPPAPAPSSCRRRCGS